MQHEAGKAITICQPWAWLIVSGHKTVENRSWPATYRGPLWIHAGKSKAWLHACDGVPGLPGRKELVYGAVLGRVDLVGCLPLREYQAQRKREGLGPDPFASGPWCHVYANARAIEPVSVGGSLSFWWWDGQGERASQPSRGLEAACLF